MSELFGPVAYTQQAHEEALAEVKESQRDHQEQVYQRLMGHLAAHTPNPDRSAASSRLPSPGEYSISPQQHAHSDLGASARPFKLVASSSDLTQELFAEDSALKHGSMPSSQCSSPLNHHQLAASSGAVSRVPSWLAHRRIFAHSAPPQSAPVSPARNQVHSQSQSLQEDTAHLLSIDAGCEGSCISPEGESRVPSPPSTQSRFRHAGHNSVATQQVISPLSSEPARRSFSRSRVVVASPAPRDPSSSASASPPLPMARDNSPQSKEMFISTVAKFFQS